MSDDREYLEENIRRINFEIKKKLSESTFLEEKEKLIGIYEDIRNDIRTLSFDIFKIRTKEYKDTNKKWLIVFILLTVFNLILIIGGKIV